MDDDNAALDILATAQAGTFWELRAARSKDTAEGEMAAYQAEKYSALLTIEFVMEVEPEAVPERMLS